MMVVLLLITILSIKYLRFASKVCWAQQLLLYLSSIMKLSSPTMILPILLL